MPPTRLDVISLARQNDCGRQNVPFVDVRRDMRADLAKHSPAEEAVVIQVDDRLISFGVHSISFEILMQNVAVRMQNQLKLLAQRLKFHFTDLVVQVYARLGAPFDNSVRQIIDVKGFVIF